MRGRGREGRYLKGGGEVFRWGDGEGKKGEGREGRNKTNLCKKIKPLKMKDSNFNDNLNTSTQTSQSPNPETRKKNKSEKL